MLARNILIFHSGALGDFIQTWPLGLALGRIFPQSRIIYVTQKQKGILAEKLLRLESMDVETGWHHLFGDSSQLPDLCRRKLEGASHVILFAGKPDDAWTAAVTAIAPKAQTISIPAGPSKQILESLSGQPVIQSAVGQILASIADQGLRFPRNADPSLVAIHPGSGSPSKCWPIDLWLRLIEQLHAVGNRCRIILGEVELERWPADDLHRLHAADETVHPAAYIDLLNELSHCSAFVGNDSGPGHLAGIIGLPSTILFGPSDPELWRPLGPRVNVLRSERLDELSPDEVFRTVLQNMPQRSSRESSRENSPIISPVNAD